MAIKGMTISLSISLLLSSAFFQPGHGRGLRSSSDLNDSSVDEFLYLRHHFGRLHVVLGSLWVLLEVLENLPHDRVGQDALDLRVLHGPGLTLLLLLLSQQARVTHVDLLDAPLKTRFQFLVILTSLLQAQLVRLHGLVVFLHEELGCGLPAVPLCEFGVLLYAQLSVLDCLGPCPQLCVASGSVAVELVGFFVHLGRASLKSLGVALDSFGEFRLLEVLVPFFSLLAALCKVHIFLFLVLLQFLLGLIQLLERVGIPMLGESLFVGRNSIL
mmetsp:Transcript_7536/g.19310  ORF Transcript_7536/g.19310 Transcript_7536/m.19310 type:complete len:272 (+) Transcript_7536:69-884(+)